MSFLVGLLSATPLCGQALSVKVTDPFSDAVTNASVAIVDQEMPTDDNGVADAGRGHRYRRFA